MDCPHTDQPAHSLLWRGSSREAVQRPQPKAGISEKMRGKGSWEPAHPIGPHEAILKAACGSDTWEVSSSLPGTQTLPSDGVK